jgi:flavin-dependent dehydrogenase
VEIGAHRAFWRDIIRDDFDAKKVFGNSLVIFADGANSNLVRALNVNPPLVPTCPNLHRERPRVAIREAAAALKNELEKRPDAMENLVPVMRDAAEGSPLATVGGQPRRRRPRVR